MYCFGGKEDLKIWKVDFLLNIIPKYLQESAIVHHVIEKSSWRYLLKDSRKFQKHH